MRVKGSNFSGEYFVVFEKGEIIPDALKEFAEIEGINSAVILNGIGMLEKITIGYFNGKEYEKEYIENPMELISLQGNLSLKNKEPFWHIHAVLGGRKGVAFSGHLFSGKIAVTCEAYLKKLDLNLVRYEESPGLWLIK